MSQLKDIQILVILEPHSYHYERAMEVRVRTNLETYTARRVFPADDMVGVFPYVMEQLTRELQHLIHEKEEG